MISLRYYLSKQTAGRDDFVEIIAITEKYIVIKAAGGSLFSKKNIIEIYQTQDGSKVKLIHPVSEEQAKKLFCMARPFHARLQLSEGASAQVEFFAGSR